VISCLALAVALGGTSYAAVLAVPRNSVGTAQLKSGAVTTAKLAGNAVVSSRVKNGSLLKVDFAPGELPAGPAGPQGPAGTPGISGLQRVDVTTSSNSVSPKTLLVNCPASKKAIGGGARVLGSGATKVSIGASFPDSSGTQWDASASEVDATVLSWQLQGYVLCATVTG
jgi:hypothetical protein